MKVHVQIVDALSGIVQSGCIEESVQKGFEVQHALSIFGINAGTVDWTIINYPTRHEKMSNATARIGQIEGTAKIITVVAID